MAGADGWEAQMIRGNMRSEIVAASTLDELREALARARAADGGLQAAADFLDDDLRGAGDLPLRLGGEEPPDVARLYGWDETHVVCAGGGAGGFETVTREEWAGAADGRRGEDQREATARRPDGRAPR